MSMVVQNNFVEEAKYDSQDSHGNILEQLKNNYLSDDQNDTSLNELQVCVNKYLIAYPFTNYTKPKAYQKMVYLYEYEDIQTPMFSEYLLVLQDKILRIYEEEDHIESQPDQPIVQIPLAAVQTVNQNV